MADTSPADGIDLPLLHRLLDVDEDDGPRVLVRQSRMVSSALVPLVMSVAGRAGVPLGSGSRDELARARGRVDEYRRIAADCRRFFGARMVKGPSLARLYPRGLVRSMSDLDLVAPDEGALWDATAYLADRYELEEMDVAVFGDPIRHLVVAPYWAAADPLLDRPLHVDLSTFAFCGDLESVPLRTTLPLHQTVADLLSLAEERFQRPFNAKDVLDTALLLHDPRLTAAGLCEAAAEYLLAPELQELIDFGKENSGLFGSMADDLIASLGRPADDERARRATCVGPRAQGVAARLAHGGLPVHGMRLRWAHPRRTWRSARLRPGPQGSTLLLTPVADYLLVADSLVPEDLYEAAHAEAERLAAEEASTEPSASVVPAAGRPAS